jgi:dTDP-4-amino-4,6-dideoxygalactose transaminase
MRKDYLVFGSPVIEDEEINAVGETLKSGWIGSGPKVAQFEEKFRDYIGVKYAVAVASCTAGLHLSVLTLGLGEDAEILVPSLTFAATANAVIHAGAKPVFVDVDREKMTINTEDMIRKISPKTKGVIPVHFAGRACNISRIEEIAKENNLKVIHDAAHAVETEYDGKKVGAYGDLANYSFYVTKNLTTSEGGMVTTNNEEIANKLKIYALHGMSKDAWKRFSDEGYKHYQVVYPGFKYNMTDLQASIGLAQINKIEKFYKRRVEVWREYKERLKDLPLILPADADNRSKHAFHLFTLLVDTERTKVTRDELMTRLHKLNIGTGVHYLALHYHPYYQKVYGYKMGDFPNAEYISDRTLSIPFSAKLTDEDVDDVTNALKEILS